VDLEADLAWLTEPIGPDDACGKSLDDTQALAALDSQRIFGRLTAPESEPDWRGLRAACLAALADSKDLRVLAHLTAAVIRVDTLANALRIFPLISTWLSRYWDEVYPRIDDDAIMRRNALTFFSDRVGVVDAFRRAPIITDPQLGSFSLRDIDIAHGAMAQPDPDARTFTADEINAALAAADLESLATLSELASAASSALENVEATMLARGGGSVAVPKLDSIEQTVRRLHQVLAPHTSRVPVEAPREAAGSAPGVARAADVGSISSRQDVVRALDAIVSYYRQSEPGSLVPLLAERAKRLVPMNFIEALAELAPEVLDPVKRAVGVRE
jgi:type VI secretion system protein ImpA